MDWFFTDLAWRTRKAILLLSACPCPILVCVGARALWLKRHSVCTACNESSTTSSTCCKVDEALWLGRRSLFGRRDPPHFLLINRPVDDQGPATLRHPFGLPLVRLNRGEAAIVAAARAVEEECGLSAESLRWHPVPITAATSHRHSEKCSFLIAYCFAWYIATGEGHFPNPFEDSFRWSSSKKLREVTRKESLGLSFAREVLAPLELTEQLLQKDVLQRSQPEEW
eukprot:s5063_g6.t2